MSAPTIQTALLDYADDLSALNAFLEETEISTIQSVTFTPDGKILILYT